MLQKVINFEWSTIMLRRVINHTRGFDEKYLINNVFQRWFFRAKSYEISPRLINFSVRLCYFFFSFSFFAIFIDFTSSHRYDIFGTPFFVLFRGNNLSRRKQGKTFSFFFLAGLVRSIFLPRHFIHFIWMCFFYCFAKKLCVYVGCMLPTMIEVWHTAHTFEANCHSSLGGAC